MSDDEVSKKAFYEFAGIVARSISMRNAQMRSEQIAEVVD
jgi:ATP-binding protein involved in chromosome partitioning